MAMFYIFVNRFFCILQKIWLKIPYNVPAAYDVFAGPVKKTAGFQGLQKCGRREAREA
jgi:hypothetical protein